MSGTEMLAEASVLFLTHKKANLGPRRVFLGGDGKTEDSAVFSERNSGAVQSSSGTKVQ